MGENRTLACPGHVAKRVRKWGLIIIVYPLPRPEGILQRHFLRKDLHPITHLCWSEEVRRNRYTLPGGKKEGKERKLHVSLVSLATVSTTAMEKTMPFLVQRWFWQHPWAFAAVCCVGQQLLMRISRLYPHACGRPVGGGTKPPPTGRPESSKQASLPHSGCGSL